MGDKPPSERRLIADRFAAFILQHDLANPFGGEVDQSADRRHYSVALSIPRLLDGVIQVYSPRFILVTMSGPLAFGGDQRLYTSEKDATDFLRLLLIEHNPDAALAVPTRPRKP